MNVLLIFDQFTHKEILIPKPDDADVEMQDFAVFLDSEGRENIGQVYHAQLTEENQENIQKCSLLRKATANDIQKWEMLKNKAEEAMNICNQKVADHKLDMQLAFTEYSLDGNRVNFIFTADDRVDFRELVKDLAKALQKQIHLQQIGPRDKAKMIKGCGKCGKCLCCSTWMKDLESITMEMVRLQNLESKGSSKLSGCCGKLMCCLRYEVDEYKRLKSKLPRVGSSVKLKDRTGEVIGLDILSQRVKVIFSDRSFEMIPLEDVKKVTPPSDTYRRSPKPTASKAK